MMSQQWTVLCDADEHKNKGLVCCASDQCSGSKSQTAKEFIKSGWKKRARGKWICPACAMKNKNHE